MKRPWLALLLLGAALPGWAETLQIPLGQQGDGSTPLPLRGDSRSQVLERFGLPDQEHPPVGRPPIRRWDYRDSASISKTTGCWTRYANRGARSPHPSAKEPS